ncbi:hypothetical protein [Falsibacillus pallidus]|uniref:Uncharacterized protein n=1 Tax=Falsibacillus pallidus TaxID=493781 RepID=A0A370GHC7_9BACI|nr:hypothetical protein [Falsibacillus pallidus]RDI43182.1 hypothetical protein DFR59_104237 [Falsibacillus pallidus]
MKNWKKKLLHISLFLLLLTAALYRPSNEDFNKWLSTNFNVVCHGPDCYHKEMSETNIPIVQTGSFEKSGYLFFSTIQRNFETSEGKHVIIKVIGIYGRFIPIVEENTQYL